MFGVSGFMYSWLMRSELGGIGEQVMSRIVISYSWPVHLAHVHAQAQQGLYMYMLRLLMRHKGYSMYTA